jgi:hypothetical protein
MLCLYCWTYEQLERHLQSFKASAADSAPPSVLYCELFPLNASAAGCWLQAWCGTYQLWTALLHELVIAVKGVLVRNCF